MPPALGARGLGFECRDRSGPSFEPVGFVRRRLTDKIPPHAPAATAPPAPGTPVRRVMMECTKCGVPDRAEALPDGLCRACRLPDHGAGESLVDLPAERDVRTYVAGLRDLLKAP